MENAREFGLDSFVTLQESSAGDEGFECIEMKMDLKIDSNYVFVVDFFNLAHGMNKST